MSHLEKPQVLSLGKFKVYPQSTQSGHFGHMTWKTVNVLAVFSIRKTPEKLSPKFLNLIAMYRAGIGQEHCPCPCSVFVMFEAGKLGFVPSVILSLKEATSLWTSWSSRSRQSP